MRVAVQHPGALRPGEQEPAVEQGRVVAGLLVALADDLGEGGAVHPLADQDVAGLRDDLGDVEVGVVQVGVPEEPLGLGLDRVVELLGHPLLELGEHRLDVQSGHQHAEEPPSRASWLKSLISALPDARVLHLHRDGPAVVPDGAVHLPDGRRRGGWSSNDSK